MVRNRPLPTPRTAPTMVEDRGDAALPVRPRRQRVVGRQRIVIGVVAAAVLAGGGVAAGTLRASAGLSGASGGPGASGTEQVGQVVTLVDAGQPAAGPVAGVEDVPVVQDQPVVTGDAVPATGRRGGSGTAPASSPPRSSTSTGAGGASGPASTGAGGTWQAGEQVGDQVGDWTPERGADIARRALRWVGTPYAWAGGNAGGPTRGVAVDEQSRNDDKVIGFDCSGLVLNAIAPYKDLAHYAATQYTQAGTVHPPLNALMPGDLLFWSSDGTVAGIHHVAIYLGGGRIVQAPYSGSHVQVTGVYRQANETIGVTRPLT